MMKALEFIRQTGEIRVVEVPKPTLPKKGGWLLVKVVAAAIDQGLAKKFPKGTSDGFFIHASGSPLYLGWHFSGVVEEISTNGNTATNDDGIIPVGTAVFGFLEYAPTQTKGTFAEYIVVNCLACGIKPESVSFELAAASATESMAALCALRDCGKLSASNQLGKSILIVGASGGVGSAAICIAKCLGASNKVTAMCSDRDVKRLQEDYQPDSVLNRSQYTEGKDPIRDCGESFDVILDCPGAYGAFSYLGKCLNHGGTFVTTVPNAGLIKGFFYSILTFWTSKRVRMVLATPARKDFDLIGEWLAQGKLKIPIDSVYKVSDMQSAIDRQASKTRNGRVVIQVDNGWDANLHHQQAATTSEGTNITEIKKDK